MPEVGPTTLATCRPRISLGRQAGAGSAKDRRSPCRTGQEPGVNTESRKGAFTCGLRPDTRRRVTDRLGGATSRIAWRNNSVQRTSLVALRHGEALARLEQTHIQDAAQHLLASRGRKGARHEEVIRDEI